MRAVSTEGHPQKRCGRGLEDTQEFAGQDGRRERMFKGEGLLEANWQSNTLNPELSVHCPSPPRMQLKFGNKHAFEQPECRLYCVKLSVLSIFRHTKMATLSASN